MFIFDFLNKKKILYITKKIPSFKWEKRISVRLLDNNNDLSTHYYLKMNVRIKDGRLYGLRLITEVERYEFKYNICWI